MQSNKERSAEESYKKFLDIMLYDVPLNQLEELVVNDVTGYGTTLDEKILEIERLRKLVIDQREQGAGHEINFVVNPVHRRINTDNGLAVFIDEIEITMSINGNKNIIPLRFSSVLELINGSWKVVHLHGSVAVNTEGDTWHKEEHLRKIEELQKIVDKKTAELLNKNRELEIETALEKVRTIAMGMRKPDDMLDVCKTISVQLQSLGVKEIRNVQTAIFYEQRGTYMNYEYYAKHDKTFITETVYTNNKIHNEFATKMQRGKGETFITHIEGDEVKNWIAYQKTTNVFIDKYLETASSLNYYWFSLGPVALGISTYHPLTEEEINLFKRFLKVFELAYLRFLDIEQAESQAREAKIEAALEKVRGHAMAMRSSEDLGATVNVFFKELKNLGFLPRRCGVAIIDEARRSAYNMITTADNIGDSFEIKGNVNLDSHFVLTNMLLNWKVQKDYFLELDTKQMEEYYRILRPQVAVTNFNDVRQYGYYLHFKEGMFYVWTDKELKVNDLQIFRRFTQVIGLTYRRHLDLQKAEAQAREAEIQLALERVRARSLAMHHTSELQDVVNIAAQQLLGIGMEINGGVFICINAEVDLELSIWASGGMADYIKKVIVPALNKPIFTTLRDAIKKGNNFLIETYSDKEKLELFTHLFNFEPWRSLPQERKQELLARKGGFARSVIISHYTSISITNHNGKSFTDAENEILKRFGKVFEQSYIRFLDLQKAESQAREAKIEASMEKIRSRSLAMQRPEELIEVAEVLRKEMGLLGLEELETSSIYIVDKKNQDAECWYAIKDIREANRKLVSDEMTLILSDTWVGNEMWKFYISEKEQTSIVMKGANRKEWINYCADKSDVLRGYYGDEIPERTYHLVKFNGGYIGAASPGDISLESWQLLKRTASVFSLAYTRFKDLQDAIARAREAQIELSLERIRARTMAMQKSEELKEVIQVVYEQFVQLNIHIEHSGFIMDYKARDDFHSWIADRFGTPSQVTIPYFDAIYYNRFNEAKGKGLDFFALTLSFEEKNRFYHDLFQHIPGFPEESKKIILDAPAFTISTVLLENVAMYIENFTSIPYSEEENSTLIRFGRVFQQTYTRFLDLQKAEAQAREAQIEAALERVRSKTMGMQKSEELCEVIAVMYRQFEALHVNHAACELILCDNKEEMLHYWSAVGFADTIPESFAIPRTIHSFFDQQWDAWKYGKEKLVLVLEGKEKSEWDELTLEKSEFSKYPENIKDFIRSRKRDVFTHAIFKYGLLESVGDEPLDDLGFSILKRFANVFEQTYTRFLDLQKAEAQNKIIQADNERKTKELEDARQLQLSMLPKELPQLSHLDIAVYMKTATEVGGDYYDFNVDANGTLTILVGDATGHGMMSGMMVSIMKSFFISNRNNIELKQFFENCNNSIKDMHLGRLMMATVGVQITSQKIIATNAGMPSLLYFRNKSQKAGEFVSHNFPLGAIKNTNYSLKEIRYEKGDTLLLMSDGFAELKNEKNEQYGYDRVKKEFMSVAQKNPNEIVEHLKTSATQWINGVEPDDDITFVVIKVK